MSFFEVRVVLKILETVRHLAMKFSKIRATAHPIRISQQKLI
jgi:hypothetical protein